MHGRDVMELLGATGKFSNPEFKPLEFEGFKAQAGANAFTQMMRSLVGNKRIAELSQSNLQEQEL
jgi:hypothetical protein